MNEKELRRTLAKIELKYLHKNLSNDNDGHKTESSNKHSAPTILFKLTASQKYVQVCTELIRIADGFDFNDVDAAFNLIVKPASIALEYLQEKKDPDALDIFFLHTIELFKTACERAEKSGQIENSHKCRLMCIDVHKLRLLALKSQDSDAIDYALLYINEIIREFPSDGRFWFQMAIINFTFLKDYSIIKSFRSLEPISRAILARDNPVNVANVSLLIDKRVNVDFSNTLLNLTLKDFQDFAEKDLQTWSFVKYFQSFSECGTFSQSELASLLLFVMAFFKVSHNSFHLKIFFESFLNAKQQTISDFWPFAVLCILKLTKETDFEPSDAIWFKIFQLLKSENVNCSLISSSNYKSFFTGTFLEEKAEVHQTLFTEYDFDEEFSIERDKILMELCEYFVEPSGPFKQFITIRSADQTLRLGAHFCEKDSSSEDEREIEDLRNLKASGINHPAVNELDESIEELRNKLASLSPNTQKPPLDYLNNSFILDTNVLLSGSPVVRSELQLRPERFLIPLIVISEIYKLKTSTYDKHNDKLSYAQDAWDFIDSLVKQDSLHVYNSYGRLLRPKEITQQLAILSLTRTQSINDDQIIHLAIQYHQNFPDVPVPVLLTEDLNMKLKAKSRGILSISVKDFRNLCNC